MAITSDNGPWTYTASGSNDTFAYLNKIFDEGDLLVELDGVALTLADYSVTGVGATSGGSVVLDSIPTAGQVVTITSAVPTVQPITFLDNGRFPASQVQEATDRALRILQQQEGSRERSLRVGDTEDAIDAFDDLTLRAGKIVGFENNAGALPTLVTPTTSTVVAASETAAGIIELATTTETNTGTDDLRAVTPLKLAGRTATETRAGIVELATTAEAIAGVDTARAVTPAGLAAAGVTLGWKPLARFVPTAAATFVISGASYFASTYSALRLTLVGIRPATDNDDLRARIAIAGTVKSGASDFAWQYKQMAITGSVQGSSNDGADSEMEIAENIGNATTESLSGTFSLYNHSSTAAIKQMNWHLVFFNGSTQLVHNIGDGAYLGGPEAINQIVFHWQGGGNFAAVGEAFLEGLRTA